MIDRIFRALSVLAYGGWRRELDAEKSAAARAFRELRERRAEEHERAVLLGP